MPTGALLWCIQHNWFKSSILTQDVVKRLLAVWMQLLRMPFVRLAGVLHYFVKEFFAATNIHGVTSDEPYKSFHPTKKRWHAACLTGAVCFQSVRDCVHGYRHRYRTGGRSPLSSSSIHLSVLHPPSAYNQRHLVVTNTDSVEKVIIMVVTRRRVYSHANSVRLYFKAFKSPQQSIP